MPQAIQTNTAPAVRKFTNIPSQAGVGGYQYHELGPMGEVIDDPEEFAKLQMEQKEVPGSFYDFTERLKSDMGDPYEINVQADAKKMLAEQEREIFQEWSGGQFRYGGYLPPKAKKEWGTYKQRLLANAEKRAQDNKESKIKEYNHHVAEWKANQEIEQDRETEGAKITGGLTEAQALKAAESKALGPDAELEALEIFYNALKKDNTPQGRQNALKAVLDWQRAQSKEEEVGVVPEGYYDTKKTSGGRKVWLPKSGKGQAFLQ